MIRAVFAVCATLSLAACSVAHEEEPTSQLEKQAVVAALADSAAGWNSGDLGRFMAVYSDEPETSFVTDDGLLRGKQALAERYTATYGFADPAKRGALSLETLDFRLLDPTHALYIGRYTLIYADGKKATGPTSLVLAKEEDGWKIIADHSS